MPCLRDFSPPSAVILVQCHCEASAHTGCGNPSPSPRPLCLKGGWHGEAVTGGFFTAPHLLLRSVGAGFYPARSSAPLVTDAGRRGRRPLRNPIRKHSVGADAYIGPPHRISCKKLSLRSQCEHWLWQSASRVPLAPLPKGGWHGEAVTGGFFTAPLATPP